MDGIIKRWEICHETQLFIEETLDPDLKYYLESKFKSPRMFENYTKLAKIKMHLQEMIIMSRRY